MIDASNLTGIHIVYDDIAEQYPALSALERQEAFLECIASLMAKGWLEFLGEDQIFDLGDVPKVGNVLREDLAPWLWIAKIIQEGRYWQSSPEERRAVREKLMFDDEVFRPEELAPNRLRVPIPNTPDEVVTIMRAKWPIELVPEIRRGDGGFAIGWFEKWCFRWHDRNQCPEIRT